MTKIQPLSVDKLHAKLNPAKLPWHNSTEIPEVRHSQTDTDPFQPRARHALELSLRIGAPDYHVYLSGEPNLGRRHILLSWLLPQAARMPIPPDRLYVPNFKDTDAPILVELPAGEGKKFKLAVEKLIEAIVASLEHRLDNDEYHEKRAAMVCKLEARQSSLMREMRDIAAASGFNLDLEHEGGVAVFPVIGGKKLEESEFDALPAERKNFFRAKGDGVVKKLTPRLRQLNRTEDLLREQERKLELQTLSETVDELLPQTVNAFENLKDFFAELKKDILANPDVFLYPEQRKEEHKSAGLLQRYAVNLLVDNSEQKGAPVIVEDYPTLANLLGCMERESEMGALVTDMTLIRAGSLQRANGGFLILRAEDILKNPAAWDALLRSLRKNQVRIEEGTDTQEGMRAKTLRPEPVPLNLRVILIGDEEIYETLLAFDGLFGKLFRLKAQMTDSAARNFPNIRHYLLRIGGIIRTESLLPFDASALAWLVDLGSHLCEDQKRLSLKFPLLREIIVEAGASAQARGHKAVTAKTLEETYSQRSWRSNLAEEEFMEDYDRNIIKVATSGAAIGQVNGLSILAQGDYEFGLPHRISCAVGVGHDGILDLEREAELGGPIHTKAIMILKSYLTSVFASKRPIALSASLHFEQSYGGIEGDSASGAELAALLSALAQVPARLDLAFTGAVSHSGQIMAVGGVSRKIEGFYKVCARHGLTGSQGVIIPRDNIAHLMLAPELLEAVAAGKFAIYAVATIEEAMELLTDMPAGKRRKDSRFTAGSLYDLVDRRLEELGYQGQNAFNGKSSKRNR